MTKGYKGFDSQLRCRGFQYEIGQEYEHAGGVELCKKGFHFCENPMDVFEYYPPSDSRYCSVESTGTEDKNIDDSKVSTSRLKINAEIGLAGLIKAGVKFILDKVDWDNKKSTNTGNRSAATNTGDCSAATNTGDWSAAIVSGKQSVAIAIGYQSKAKGSKGCWLVLGEKNGYGELIDVQCRKVDGVKIKEDTFYMLVNGEFKEVK